MKNDNQMRGLPKDIDLLLQVAMSATKEATDNNRNTKRMELLNRLANSVNKDYQEMINKSYFTS
jgi:hypothetical protein